MTRTTLRDVARAGRRVAAGVLGLTLVQPLFAHATFPGAAPPLPNSAAERTAQTPRAGEGLRDRRDAAYYRASIAHCRQLHGRVRTLCFDEAAQLYGR